MASRPAPKSDESFGTKQYWDWHYGGCDAQRPDDDTDEWYLQYSQLEGLLAPALRQGRDSAVLDMGCGTSRMLRDMREAGHLGLLVGSDFSGVDLARRCNAGHDIRVEEVDARSCSELFGAESFDAVLDKGTLDALWCGVNGTDNARWSEEEGMENVRREQPTRHRQPAAASLPTLVGVFQYDSAAQGRKRLSAAD